jgi:hypothetical protein
MPYVIGWAMRPAGVSDDCAAIRSAFVYDGLLYETEASNL